MNRSDIMFNTIIEEICKELNIKYTYLSNKWIMKLEINNKTRFISGYKFDLNNHGIGLVMDDKYAFYDALKSIDIPVCTHSILYREDNSNDYAQNCHTKEDIIYYFNKYNKDVVIKPNIGSLGDSVYHVTNIEDLLEKTSKLLINNFSISICPFYKIKNEYRLIILDNKVKLIFRKERSKIIGDGKSSIKDLLIKLNKYYFENIDLPNTILKKNEEYIYDWRFNLSKGSIATINIDDKLKDRLSRISLDVTNKLNIKFASVDIIELDNNELLVLEANSGVSIDKVINFIPNGYNIAKDIYKEAIIKMFKD